MKLDPHGCTARDIMGDGVVDAPLNLVVCDAAVATQCLHKVVDDLWIGWVLFHATTGDPDCMVRVRQIGGEVVEEKRRDPHRRVHACSREPPATLNEE